MTKRNTPYIHTLLALTPRNREEPKLTGKAIEMLADKINAVLHSK